MSASQQTDVKPGRSPGRPRPADVADLERRLLAVALKEFLQHGYGGTSMARIVRIAGVSKTTLYSRFPSKAELFRAIVHRQIERISPSAMLAPSIESPSSLEEELKTYANYMLELSLHGELLAVNRLIYSESHRFPELGMAAAERTERGVEQISDIIGKSAIAEGIPCRNPDAIARAFILMLRGWYINVMLTNREVSVKEREQWVEQAVHILVSDRKAW